MVHCPESDMTDDDHPVSDISDDALCIRQLIVHCPESDMTDGDHPVSDTSDDALCIS